MFTTAGVTTLATSENPSPGPLASGGAARLVTDTPVGLDACESAPEFPAQKATALSIARPAIIPTGRVKNCFNGFIGSSLLHLREPWYSLIGVPIALLNAMGQRNGCNDQM
jgi:hypothetical protein